MLQCSLCSRTFQRQDLRCNPVGGGVARNTEYLCQQCWQVLCGQPWPEDVDGSVHGGRLFQAQQQQQKVQAGLARVGSAPMSGLSGQVSAGLLHQQQQQAAAAAAAAATGQRVHGGAANGMGRRSMSYADMQAAAAQAQGIAIGSARQGGWHPSSMPEQAAILGGADDLRWGALAASAGGQPSGYGLHPGGASAPSQPMFLGASLAQQQRQQAPSFSPHEMQNLLDEQSLELFESQSHLLDPEAREAVARQRQFLEWQASSMEEPGPMAAALERQDSAGSGNEPNEAGSMKRQLRAVVTERDRQASRSNELCQQLQEKKRQLFSAIQEREKLKEQVRGLESKLQEFQEVLQCKLCRQRPRNCVVLPCLHFLYCDECFKARVSANPACPACGCSVSGYQVLQLMR